MIQGVRSSADQTQVIGASGHQANAAMGDEVDSFGSETKWLDIKDAKAGVETNDEGPDIFIEREVEDGRVSWYK